MPYTEVAKKVFVSGGTVHVRMRKLEKMGVVRGTKLDIDYDKLGYNISSYMGIYLEKSFLYKETVKSLKKIPEIVEIHAITGQYTIFIKIICKDTLISEISLTQYTKLRASPGQKHSCRLRKQF